jgi:hypothetical protein
MEIAKGISDADEHCVIAVIQADVAATVARDCRGLIVEAAARLRRFCDRDDYLTRVVDDVQQRLHDEFIDTTWPACPEHPSHPLWFDGENWYCEQSGTVVAPLGQLRRPA